jgi:hypothetical protein
MYNMYIFLVDLLDIFITVIVINLQFLNNVIIIKSKDVDNTFTRSLSCQLQSIEDL